MTEEEKELEKRIEERIFKLVEKHPEGDLNREIVNKIKKQEKRRMPKEKNNKRKIRIAAVGTVLVTAGIVIHGCNTTKGEDKQEFKPITTGQENDNVQKSEEKEDSIKETVNNFENSEDVRAFLKNWYVELHEKMTGDTTLTTADIGMYSGCSYEDYVYVDKNTRQMITHGDTPADTEQRLQQMGVSYTIKENVKVYKVYNKKYNEETGEYEKDGVRECITIVEGVPVAVIVGEKYGKPELFILDKMGNIISTGLDYAGSLDQGSEDEIKEDKEEFEKALQDEQNKEKSDDEKEL